MVTTTTGPTQRPITLQEAKTWCAVDSTDTDALIEMLIDSATEIAEEQTGLALGSRTLVEYFDTLSTPFELTVAPVTAIASIHYRDSTDGAYQVWSATNYDTDLISMPARIILKPNGTFPTVGAYGNAIKVTYTAGYSATNIPKRAKQLILLMVAKGYDNREDMEENESNNVRQRSANILIKQLQTVKI